MALWMSEKVGGRAELEEEEVADWMMGEELEADWKVSKVRGVA